MVVLPDEQCFSVVNAAAGWAELIEKLRGLNIAAIGIEASGGYERGIVRALLAARYSVRLINPFKLRQFAKACGVLAKNDRIVRNACDITAGPRELGPVRSRLDRPHRG